MMRQTRLRRCGGHRLLVGMAACWVLFAAGCASSPPSRFYTLTSLPESERQTADIKGGELAIGIGPVVFPQFLDRPQLVVRDSANRLDLREFNRWGGTVQDDFLRVWGENLAYLLDTSRLVIFPSESRMPLDFRVTAEVINFEGQADAEAVLKVRWSVMDERLRESMASQIDVYRCPVQAEGDPAPETSSAQGGPLGGGTDARMSAQRSEAIVAAMSRCLGQFSRDVAAVISTLPRPAPEATTAL